MPAERSAAAPPTRPLAAVAERLRRPRQLRGERRVEVILDAAAALIAEGGAESLTVQALADRARTSKGSLYHFFPDLQAVLCALADRHGAAITRLTAALIADPSIEWARLTLDETVDRFLAPVAYLEAHPDLLALARMPMVLDGTTKRLTPIRDLAIHILKQRCPALPARQRLAGASTMVALLDGIVGYGLRSDDVAPRHMLAELRRALRAYLGALGQCGRLAAGS
jgi:AcrR family transcriptional regulator